MLDYLKDLFETCKERLTNPFIGTLVLVWFLRNFYFVYTLFNFDDDATLVRKMTEIKAYIAGFHWYDLPINIIIALAILVANYFFRAAVDIVQGYYHDIVSKKIKEHTMGKSPFTKADYEVMLAKQYELNGAIDTERQKTLTNEKVVKDLMEKLASANQRIEDLENENLSLKPKAEIPMTEVTGESGVSSSDTLSIMELEQLTPSVIRSIISSVNLSKIQFRNEVKNASAEFFKFPKIIRDKIKDSFTNEVAEDFVTKVLLLKNEANRPMYYPYRMFQFYEDLNLLTSDGRTVNGEIKLSQITTTNLGDILFTYYAEGLDFRA